MLLFFLLLCFSVSFFPLLFYMLLFFLLLSVLQSSEMYPICRVFVISVYVVNKEYLHVIMTFCTLCLYTMDDVHFFFSINTTHTIDSLFFGYHMSYSISGMLYRAEFSIYYYEN